MTDVPGLGPIPDRWTALSARRVLARQKRRVGPNDETVTAFRDGQVTLRRLRRLEGFTEAIQEIGYHGCKAGDLAVHSMDGFAGAIGVAQEDGKVSPVVHLYRAADGQTDLRFIAYVLRQVAFSGYVLSLAKGIRERSSSFDPAMLVDVLLPIPPAEEQRRIANFLDDQVAVLNLAIELRQRQRTLSKEAGEAEIDDMVRGCSNPDRHEADYEPLGQVPRHWGQGRLRSVRCEVQTGPFGSQLHAGEYVEDGWPVVNPANLRGGNIIADPAMTVDDATCARLAHHRLREGDVVFGRRGELGRSALVGSDQVGWLCGTGSLRVRLVETAFDGSYLSRFLRLPAVRHYFQSTSVGSTMDNLNTSILLGMPLLMPPLDEQKAMARACDESAARADRADRLIG